MTTNRSVSVVIPVGRVDDDLPLQLEALADQSFDDPWQLVLSLNSDDPAERRSLDRLLEGCGNGARSSTTIIVDSSAVRSASHARNVGAGAADGELLLFCDGDDIADVGWMAALVEALDHHRAVGGYLEERLLAVPGQEDWRPPATPARCRPFSASPSWSRPTWVCAARSSRPSADSIPA